MKICKNSVSRYSINADQFKTIRINVGKTFFKLIKKYFEKSATLMKLFNKDILKINYCWRDDIKKIINKHN